MAKGMMIVDGQRVNFDGEKNVLSVIRKAGIEMPTFAITPTSPFTARAACAWWRMKRPARSTRAARWSRATACASARTARGFSSTGASFWSCCLPRTTATAPPAKRAATAAYRSLPSSSVCAEFASPIRASTTRSTARRLRCCATRTSASSAATVCACARRCRVWAF